MIGGWYGDGNNYNTCYVSVCMYDKSRNELEKVPITIIKHQIVWLVTTRQIEFLIVWLHEHLMVFRTFFFFLYLSINLTHWIIIFIIIINLISWQKLQEFPQGRMFECWIMYEFIQQFHEFIYTNYITKLQNYIINKHY